METKVAKIIGIDISKEKFDVSYYNASGNHVAETYSFEEGSIKKFIARIDAEGVCVMEATGTYHLRLAYRLYESGLQVSVVNPLSVKNYIRMRMKRAKTDRKDAELIRCYGEQNREELPRFEPESESLVEVRQLYNVHELLLVQRTALRNQQEAMSVSYVKNHTAVKVLARQVSKIESEIKAIEQEIEKLIDRHNHDDYERLQSIPGVGKKSAALLIATTDAMKKFESPKQLISYYGLAPRVYQSGSTVRGKERICKMGMAGMRKLLYLCAVSACRCNPACREYYLQLLARGKARKLALVAVANKLLKIAFALIKKQTTFSFEYNS